MTGSVRSAAWQGVLAAFVTFVVVMLPTLAIAYGAQVGTVGTVSVTGFTSVATVVLAAVATAVGVLVFRSYQLDPERRPGEVWSTWFTGFVVLVVGSWFAPFLVLFVFVDSDHALSDRMPAVLTVWIAAHLATAGLAWRLMRNLAVPPSSVRRQPPGPA